MLSILILVSGNSETCIRNNFTFRVTEVLFSCGIVKLGYNFRKFSYFLVNLKNNFLIFSYKLLKILILVSADSETCNRNNFTFWTTKVLFTYSFVKLGYNFRKFSYFLVNLRNNFLIFSYKVLKILILVSGNSETCNRNNFTFWVTEVLCSYSFVKLR